MSKKSKVGRPKIEVKRDHPLTIWLSDEEFELVRSAANEIALSDSAYGRVAILEKVRSKVTGYKLNE